MKSERINELNKVLARLDELDPSWKYTDVGGFRSNRSIFSGCENVSALLWIHPNKYETDIDEAEINITEVLDSKSVPIFVAKYYANSESECYHRIAQYISQRIKPSTVPADDIADAKKRFWG